MGLLRFILAFDVMLFHIESISSLANFDINVAISVFFIISGFFMALILNEKYTPQPGSVFLYISNRFLRIYPVYWAMLLLVIMFSVAKMLLPVGSADNMISHYFLYYDGPPEAFWFSLTNFVTRNLTLLLTVDYFWESSRTAGFFLVQQAWTLQLEVLFYLSAPLVARLKRKQLFFASLGYLVAYYPLISLRLAPLPFLAINLVYFFVFFLMGIWSYHGYQILKRRSQDLRLTPLIMVGILLLIHAVPLALTLPPNFLNLQVASFYLVVTASLPFFFFFTQRHSFDATLGELSYPIYISHFIVIKLVNNVPFLNQNAGLAVALSIGLTVLTSVLLIKYIDRPINRFRQRRAAVLEVSKQA